MSETKKPIIEISNLAIGYGEKTVAKDINVQVYEGELLGIVGCNGAGKSTFLKTIRGLLEKHAGEIKYYGVPMEQLKERDFAQKVAYLQQHVEVGFGYTAKEIVVAGRYPYLNWWESEREQDKQLVMDCLEYTGTKELAERPVNEVSGGQKQRILLAKVLAQQTPILFLDEPTTGLDLVYQEEIFRFAKELSDMGKTIIMVIHELNLAAKYCDRILLLGEGKLLADGKPKEVFTAELLSRAYEARVVVSQNPVSGNLEITTEPNPTNKAKTQALLQKICL